MTTIPKLPLQRVRSTTGYIWRQADGTLFSVAEHEEWLWSRLTKAEMYDAAEAQIDELADAAYTLSRMTP